MVELVDTLDLGSSALWACRFDPCSRYFSPTPSETGPPHLPIPLFFKFMEENKKHILIGSSLIVFFFLCLGGVAAAAYLPGFSGELGRMCLALITSPFLMESAIFFLALTLLFAINGWRRNREGDDWVTLDEKGLPKRDK